MYAILIERGGIKPFCHSSHILQTLGIQAGPYHLGIIPLAFMTKGCAAIALYPNLGRLPSFKVVWTSRRYSCQERVEQQLALHQETQLRKRNKKALCSGVSTATLR